MGAFYRLVLRSVKFCLKFEFVIFLDDGCTDVFLLLWNVYTLGLINAVEFG